MFTKACRRLLNKLRYCKTQVTAHVGPDTGLQQSH